MLPLPPSEVLREHLYVSPFYEPYYEALMKQLVEALGIDRLIFGSDWPHGEEKPPPLHDLPHVEGLAPGQVGKLMRGYGLNLLGLD